MRLQVHLIYPKPGFVEIDPEQLWNSIIKSIEDAVKGIVFANEIIKRKEIRDLNTSKFRCETRNQ